MSKKSYTHSSDRIDTFIIYCENGDMKSMNEMLSVMKPTDEHYDMYINEGMYEAAKENKFDAIKALMASKGKEFNINHVFQGACEGGKFEIIYYLIEKGADDMMKGLQGAVASGDIKVVTLLLDLLNSHNGTQLLTKSNLLYYACYGGNEEIVDMVIKWGEKNWQSGFGAACEAGHLNIAKKMMKLGAKDYEIPFADACYDGRTEIVKYFLNNNLAKNYKQAFECACSGGNLEIVMMLAHKVPNKSSGFQAAYREGHKPVMKYLMMLEKK